MNLDEIRRKHLSDGYNMLNASSKACQDVILLKLAKSYLSKNVTIKGGAIIQHIWKGRTQRGIIGLRFLFAK